MMKPLERIGSKHLVLVLQKDRSFTTSDAIVTTLKGETNKEKLKYYFIQG